MAACSASALIVGAGPVAAGQTQVAVAANFTAPAKEIAALFKAKTGDEALLSFGASGNFYTQIAQGAPFQVFLSADADRPKAAIDAGLAVADSRFTYAVGKLVLWSKSLDLTKGDDVLKANAFAKLSIANPKAAPYGAAAVEAMKSLGVYDAIEPKIVAGDQHRPGVPVRRHRQRRTRFRRAVAAQRRHGGIALGAAAERFTRRSVRTQCCSRPAPTTQRRRPSSPSSGPTKRGR